MYNIKNLAQMNNELSLQKLTNFEEKFKSILCLKKIELNDIDLLDENEKKELSVYLTLKVNSLEGESRDNFINKISALLPKSTKNQLWESNQVEIIASMSNLIQQFGRMPSINELAIETKLSRQTIYKHLKEYSVSNMYEMQIKQFQFLSLKVMSKLFKYAVNGDVRACKIYLEMAGFNNEKLIHGETNKTQNNYILINNTIVSQENLSKLNENQIIKIESILREVL